MKSKEIFGMAVRLLGLVFLYHGLREFPAAFGIIIDSFQRDLGDQVLRLNGSRFFAGILLACWPLAIAWFLVRRTPLLVSAAYPDDVAGSGKDAEAAEALLRKSEA